MDRFLVTIAFCFFGILACAQTPDKNLGVIPAPNSIKINSGSFQFSRESAITFETMADEKIARLFHDFLKNNYFLDLPVAKKFVKAPKGIIKFSSATNLKLHPEGYQLTISPSNILVAGKGSGLFYGLQSLMQMMPLEKVAAPKLTCAVIEDQPRYSYRGMHLDVARHFFPVSFVKKYIGLLAQYKINTFHWHLTDDQGWRIEIKKYPKLTQVGAYRDQTIIGHGQDRMPQWFDGTRYGGFYTQDEVKDVVSFAAERFVTVIPEIEMPGHALAALASYPELGCGDKPGPYDVSQKWGVFEDVYCAGKENTFSFLEDVLTEVIPLFPSKFIHIGGDECPKTRWKACPYCQKRIKDNNLKDEHELQSYFVQRMEKFLNSKGKQIIGWDEILEGGLAPNATVMSWRGTDGGIAAAKQNHDAIMTPGNFLYFDHAQGKSDQEPVSIGNYTPLSETYSYNPTPADLTPAEQKRIIGVQANLWTEYIASEAKAEYRALPRMLALAEIAWTLPENKDWKDFSETRIPKRLALLDRTNTLYHVPTAINAKDTTIIARSYTLDLKPAVTGAKIYYTLDTYLPRETDKLYTGPVVIKVPSGQKRVVKTISITPSGKRSAVTTTTITNFEPLASRTDVTTKGTGLKYHFVPGEFEVVAGIDSLKATLTGTAENFSITKLKPKARTFGLIYSGYITIPADGVYKFTTISDDGSQIWIDDTLVTDNDKKHALFESTSGVSLKKGIHKFEVRYFQAGGAGDLKIFVSEGETDRKEIPSQWLSH